MTTKEYLDNAQSDARSLVANMDDDSLIALAGDAASFLAREETDYLARTQEARATLEDARAEIIRRILDAGGTALPHPDYVVKVERSKTLEKRIDVLRELEGVVPEADLAPALYLSQPAPQWRADGTKLQALARKYGGKVAQIVNDGITHVYGAPKLSIQPRTAMKHAASRAAIAE